MKISNKIWLIIGIISLILLFVAGGFWFSVRNADYDSFPDVPPAEVAPRSKLVSTAQEWLGAKESDNSHTAIIDLYNRHEPLAQGYTVKYDDEWCATFVSAVAIQCQITDIIPTECGCQRQIGLFQQLGVWVEDDSYKPLPGDIIYYCREDNSTSGDCTGWADHVGIVVGTNGSYIKVIEGNYGDEVGYRYIKVDAPGIRGYAVPDYGSISE